MNCGLCNNFMNFSNGFNIATSASETKNVTKKLKPAILMDTNDPKMLPNEIGFINCDNIFLLLNKFDLISK